MKKTFIALGLIVAASGAYAGKPSDGGGDPAPSLEYTYIGNTAEPFNRTFTYRGTLTDLVAECVADYGTGARPATSKEVADAIYAGAWQNPQGDIKTILLSADPVAVGAASGTAAFSKMRDVHLHTSIDPDRPFMMASSSGNFGSSYSTGYSSGDDQPLYNVACSTLQ